MVRVRCTPAERARLEERARAAGLTISGMMRQAALTARIRSSDRAELGAVAAQFGRVGGLLNQLAAKANAGRIVPAGPVMDACNELRPILAELRRLLGGEAPTERRVPRRGPEPDDLSDDLGDDLETDSGRW